MREEKKKMKTFVSLVFLVAGLMLLPFGASLHAEEKPDQINVATFGDPSTLKIGWAEGWFEQETGVKTKFNTFDSGSDVILAMSSGDLDIASLGSTPTAIALGRGLEIKIIAIEMDLGDNEALIVSQDLQVVNDLKSKKIGVPFGSTAHYHLMRVLNLYNIDESDLTVIDMGAMEAAGAFKGGLIDGAWIWDPGYSAMISNGGHVMMASGTVGKMGFPTWNNIVVRKKFAEEYPETVVKWLKAFMRTVDFYHEKPDEAAKIVSKRLGTEYEVAKKLMRGFGFLKLEEQLTSNWLAAPGEAGNIAKGLRQHSLFLVDQKSIPKPLELEDIVKAVDSSYLKKLQAM